MIINYYLCSANKIKGNGEPTTPPQLQDNMRHIDIRVITREEAKGLIADAEKRVAELSAKHNLTDFGKFRLNGAKDIIAKWNKILTTYPDAEEIYMIGGNVVKVEVTTLMTKEEYGRAK